MKVQKGEKLTTIYKGKQIGFCGDYCKEKFEENPEKFIKQ
jgi:YHS domain-containing protein